MDLFENKFDLHCAKCAYFIMALYNVSNGSYIFSVLSSETHIEQNCPVQVGNEHVSCIIPFLSVK